MSAAAAITAAADTFTQWGRPGVCHHDLRGTVTAGCWTPRLARYSAAAYGQPTATYGQVSYGQAVSYAQPTYAQPTYARDPDPMQNWVALWWNPP